jgi:hypothetical protein
MSSVGASKAFVKQCQGIMANWYNTQKDQIEVRQIVDTNDGYGNYRQVFTPSVPPLIVAGLLRTVERIPGEFVGGDSPAIAGNFIVHLDAGVSVSVVPNKTGFVVNGGDTYIAQNAYNDKGDRLSNAWYCYRVE